MLSRPILQGGGTRFSRCFFVRAKIRGSKLDTGVYLDSLKKLSSDEQWEKVNEDFISPSRHRQIGGVQSDHR